MAAACLDGLDTAFDYLDKAYDEHDPLLLMLKYEPLVPFIFKGDPRYKQFIERIGFP